MLFTLFVNIVLRIFQYVKVDTDYCKFYIINHYKLPLLFWIPTFSYTKRFSNHFWSWRTIVRFVGFDKNTLIKEEKKLIIVHLMLTSTTTIIRWNWGENWGIPIFYFLIKRSCLLFSLKLNHPLMTHFRRQGDVNFTQTFKYSVIFYEKLFVGNFDVA